MFDPRYHCLEHLRTRKNMKDMEKLLRGRSDHSSLLHRLSVTLFGPTLYLQVLIYISTPHFQGCVKVWKLLGSNILKLGTKPVDTSPILSHPLEVKRAWQIFLGSCWMLEMCRLRLKQWDYQCINTRHLIIPTTFLFCRCREVSRLIAPGSNRQNRGCRH